MTEFPTVVRELIEQFGRKRLVRERDTHETLVCRCPDCEGTVCVPKSWPVASMLPVILSVYCQMCHQVWYVLSKEPVIEVVQSGPSWGPSNRREEEADGS